MRRRPAARESGRGVGRLKILQIHDYVAPGNSRSGLDMCRRLIERGHEVRVMGGVGELGPADGAVVDGIAFHTYPFGRDRGTLGYLMYSRRMNRDVFERVLGGFQPDVLFFMQPLCTNGVMRSPAARERRRAYHFFSPWAREWEIANDAGGMWRALNVAFRRRSERKALDAVGRVMCASRYMRSQLLEQHADYPADRITILSGAVDVERFRPTGPKLNGPFTVFTMRRLVRRMGVDLLIEAVRRLPNVRLVVGGDGPERAALESQADGRAEFLGYVPDNELPKRYSEADLVVLPTRELEGFGLVLIEAMACGTPAMGTRIGGIPEVLEGLDPRLVIPEPTPDAIAAAIESFRSDATWRRSLESRCRDYVVERFGWPKIAPILEAALS